MKVSSKIIAGFLIVMLLSIVVLANQLSVIHQMQTINREISEIDMTAASTVLRMQEVASVIKEDYRKVFNRLKTQGLQADPDFLPVDLNIAVDHLQAQTEIAYEAIKGSIKD